jgi:hypothetical protein
MNKKLFLKLTTFFLILLALVSFIFYQNNNYKYNKEKVNNNEYDIIINKNQNKNDIKIKNIETKKIPEIITKKNSNKYIIINNEKNKNNIPIRDINVKTNKIPTEMKSTNKKITPKIQEKKPIILKKTESFINPIFNYDLLYVYNNNIQYNINDKFKTTQEYLFKKYEKKYYQINKYENQYDDEGKKIIKTKVFQNVELIKNGITETQEKLSHYYEYKYDKKGLLSEIKKLSPNHLIQMKYKYKYNEEGLLLECQCHYEDRENIYLIFLNKYDSQKLLIETKVYNYHFKNLIKRFVNQYNNQQKIVSTQLYINGLESEYYDSKFENEYDEKGKLIKTIFYDQNNDKIFQFENQY